MVDTWEVTLVHLNFPKYDENFRPIGEIIEAKWTLVYDLPADEIKITQYPGDGQRIPEEVMRRIRANPSNAEWRVNELELWYWRGAPLIGKREPDDVYALQTEAKFAKSVDINCRVIIRPNVHEGTMRVSLRDKSYNVMTGDDVIQRLAPRIAQTVRRSISSTGNQWGDARLTLDQRRYEVHWAVTSVEWGMHG